MNLNHSLSVRSDFSLGESILQIDRLVEVAKLAGYQSVALTDTMTISGMTRFTSACKKAGIKPIIGVSLRVYDDPVLKEKGRFYMLKAYICNDAGMRGILKLLSRGFQDDHFYYHARVGLEEICELLPRDGVILTTGDLFSVWHHPAHQEICLRLQTEGFPLYCEIVPINTPLFDTLNKIAGDTALDLNLPTVVTLPVYYAEAKEADSLDVHRAITSNGKMGSRTLSIPFVRDMCMKTPIDLVRACKGLTAREPSLGELVVAGLKGVEQIAERCTYEFKKLQPTLPKMAENEFLTLAGLVKEGWATRFARPVFGHVPTDLEPYRQRLAYELSVLRSMGFAGYFLLVAHIVSWSKENGIYVGPGRGSVGGSLVAYLMGITDVDPIRFGLIFERFINPERIDLPDADLDFQTSRRQEVIQHIIEKFGSDHVAGISNYSTLGAASAMRDTSRVHELDPFAYSCSKQMEKEHGVSLSLEESAEKVPDIHKFKNEYPHIWQHATTLEGCMRNLGKHAAGVVVAGEPITNRAVVETRGASDTGGICNWDKTIVEDWGLIKMDVLGLATLDVLALASDYIKERHGKRVDLLRLPLDDKEVMREFGKGNTTGVFQFDSSGMKSLLKSMAEGGELTFEDVTAATALFRPGPLDAGLCDQFVQIKRGVREPYYEHQLVEESLNETYGVVVYQEQVMKVSRDLSGFTFAEADHLRKAIGKKDMKKMSEYADKFIDGATAGQVEVELEDGSKKLVHRSAKFKVAECEDRFTVEEIAAKNYTLAEAL